MSNSMISELGGVTMKTIDEVKPVIDDAVANAGAVREMVADNKDRALDKDAPGIEGKISVQEPQREDARQAGIQAGAPEAQAETEKEADDGPDFE